MPPGDPTEHGLVPGRHEVGEHEDDRAPPERRLQLGEGEPQVGAGAPGWKASRSLMRRSTWRRPLAGGRCYSTRSVKRISADPVVVPRRREREHRRQLGGELALGAQAAAERRPRR